MFGLVATRFADTPLMVIPGFFAMFQTALFVINLILSVLLFIKGKIQARGDTIRLGSAYLFVTLMIIPQMASFPDGFLPMPLLGSPQTPLWIWCFWRLGFALAILRYAWFASRSTRLVPSVGISVTIVIASVIAATWVAVSCTDELPVVLANGRLVPTGAEALFVPPAVMTVAALIAVARIRPTSPKRLWLLVGLVATCMELWLSLNVTGRFTVGWYFAKVGTLVASAAVLISLLHEITSLYSAAEKANAVLRSLARSDGLTGIGNRRDFDERLDEAFRAARRQQHPLALIMLDIDFFKGFNDTYGHQGGDGCLRQVSAEVARGARRPGDSVARYGGEEIAMLLPGADVDSAALIAERIRASIERLAIPHSASPFGVVTVSAGIASLLPLIGQGQPSDLVSAADQALYLAKQGGRNRVAATTAANAPAPRSPVPVA